MNLVDWTKGVLQNGLPAELDQAVSGFLKPNGDLPVAAVAATPAEVKTAQNVASNAAPATTASGPATIPQGVPGAGNQTTTVLPWGMIVAGVAALGLIVYLARK